MVTRTEGGLRRHRIEFVREDDQGEMPEDPEWERYSDTVREFEWAPETNIEPSMGIGDVDPATFYKGFEEHEVVVIYDMQKWFLDEEGNPYDAAYDATERDIDNQIADSHTIVDRESKTNLNPTQTVNGEESRDTRIYVVVHGAMVDEALVEGDPGSQNPVNVELEYLAEKGRSYQIDQPAEPTEIVVQSTEAEDDHQTLTIEQEDGTSEEIELNGETPVVTTESFEDIDGARLDEETVGNVEIYEGDGEGSPDVLLSIIHGEAEYNNTEGDLGVPVTGDGSHADPIDEDFELIIGDTIEQPAGSQFALDVNMFSLVVSNEIEQEERVESVRSRIDVGEREAMAEASIVGENETHQKMLDHLTVTETDILWHMDGGTVTVEDAVLMDPGEKTIEAGEAALVLDCEFRGRSLNFDPN